MGLKPRKSDSSCKRRKRSQQSKPEEKQGKVEAVFLWKLRLLAVAELADAGDDVTSARTKRASNIHLEPLPLVPA